MKGAAPCVLVVANGLQNRHRLSVAGILSVPVAGVPTGSRMAVRTNLNAKKQSTEN